MVLHDTLRIDIEASVGIVGPGNEDWNNCVPCTLRVLGVVRTWQ